MSEQLEKDNVPFAYEVRYSRRRTQIGRAHV